MTRFPIKATNGKIRFIKLSSIFYIEAEQGDILIRTRGKGKHRSVDRIDRAEK